MTWQDALLSAAERIEVNIDKDMIEMFSSYLDMIKTASKRMNLISFTDDTELAVRHFADSLACLQVMPGDAANCIDIGCGAGLPGIPLKIVRPDLRVVLVESVGKKTDFMSSAIESLKLTDITVIQDRAEVLGRGGEHRESYLAAVSRAAASPAVTLEYILPLVKTGGCAILFLGDGKSVLCESEDEVLRLLGGSVGSARKYRLTDDGPERTVVRVDKTGPTAPEYPRRTGVPKKRPLGIMK